jgi:hypothetical protein
MFLTLLALADLQAKNRKQMEATEDPRALNGLATRWPKGVSGNIHGRPLMRHPPHH